MGKLIPFKDVPANQFVRPVDLPFTCTNERLLEAVQCWMLGFKEEEVARLLHIPRKALAHWVHAAGWKMLEDSLREPIRKAVVGQTTRLVSRLVSEMNDRLDKGDPVFDMEGTEIGRRGVKFKELSTAFVGLVGKQLELEKNLGPLRDANDKPSVEKLMTALEAWAERKEKVIEGTQ